MQDTLVQLTWEDLVPHVPIYTLTSKDLPEIEGKMEEVIPHVPIYTIGYGGRSIAQFFELLHYYAIKFLIDVRSQPHSRFNQQFSRGMLEKTAKRQQVDYIFMGDTLGGRPDDSSCYLDGKVDYAKVREKAFFQQGISRIRTAWDKELAVAIMCAELKPQECHRSKLIGNTLCIHNMNVAHINELGELKTQQEINELLLGKQQLSLFENDHRSIMENTKVNFSRKTYSPSNRK
jgi:uncharacterized protein (DUF488 family)